MSRIGRLPIPVPAGVTVTVDADNEGIEVQRGHMTINGGVFRNNRTGTLGGGLYQILVLSIGEGFPEANGGLLIRGGNADDAQQHYKSQQGGENRTHFHTHVLHIPNIFVLM